MRLPARWATRKGRRAASGPGSGEEGETTTNECSRVSSPLDLTRNGEAYEHDEGPRDDVEQEMVGRCQYRKPHRERRHERERAHCHVGRRQEEDDPDRKVPTEMEARKRGVLVRQARRL